MRALTQPSDPLFLCPECGNPLPVRPPCACGFVLRESDGIIDLLGENESARVKSFVDAYDRVRADEEWGGDDLDLPFHPKRHHAIWKIRQRTFRAFESLMKTVPRGLAIDLGAGNCWMTRYLDQWGFDAIAVDINTSTRDGLRAGQKFIDEGAVFLRVRARMERLPIASERITLLATNASFHYAGDFRAALLEFERVLTPGGRIAIIDTPFYDRSADGDRMMANRVEEFRMKYGISESLARQSSYMTYTVLQELAESLHLRTKIIDVFPGVPRKYEEWRALILGHRVAKFPVVVLEKDWTRR